MINFLVLLNAFSFTFLILLLRYMIMKKNKGDYKRQEIKQII